LHIFLSAGSLRVAAESRRMKKELNHRVTDGFARDDFVREADIDLVSSAKRTAAASGGETIRQQNQGRDRLRRQNHTEKELKVKSVQRDECHTAIIGDFGKKIVNVCSNIW
jgi:hypothetical protein